MAKKKISNKANNRSLFEQHTNLKWLLPLLFTVIALVMFVQTIKEKSLMMEMEVAKLATYRTYTNPPKTFSIEYPENWIVKESHEISNRDVDDPKEINTATLIGKEGEVVLQWGPMGFGGGCNTENSHSFTMKNKTMSICNGVQENGKAFWAGIGDERHADFPMAARATANPPLKNNEKVVENILSTISFN